MKSIPVHQLQDNTNAGLQIKVFRAGDKQQNKIAAVEAHRDDHYIFFLLTSGFGTLKVDLQDIILTAGQLYYILPSQIHYRIKPSDAEGWFLAVDISLIPPGFRDIFERQPNSQTPCSLTPYELKQYSALLGLLVEEFVERQNSTYYLPIIHTLTQSFLAMAASTYSGVQQATENKLTRSSELVRQFKNLLAVHSHTMRNPSDYASKLNVSLGYLNESIKKATGSPVSYWIQQEILSEAKRLLYHSDSDVKQIAGELGYTDYAYFSRFFRKASGMSPSGFRVSSRKQSSK
jgi:AraC family transcriptional regulator, transcriptional activator of pobA